MHRRSVLCSMLGVAPVLGWQDPLAQIPTTAAEAVSMGLAKFFSAADLESFAVLGDVLVPAFDGRPSARDAEAADFLDFLIGQSPADIQTLYRSGLATWNVRRRSGTAAALNELGEPWSHAGPTAPYAKFLAAAKIAFYQATVNSRQWATAMAGRSRASAGIGSYWLPIE